MIFMPPRHGKTELASKRFPAWYIGRNPSHQIITASYSGDLSSDFGREVRNIVASQEYANLFESGLRDDSRAANRWNTEDGGSYVAVGVGGAITGRGANIALIDDPFKDRQDADSETIRERVWAWYQSTLYTRLMPRGAIVLIQTRWHEDDLAGRLLELQERGGDQWEVLELSAETNGEALWPEWYSWESLQRIKRAIGPREYSALYQQQPQPDEGTFFKREWFDFYELSDVQDMHMYATGDFAVTEGGGDFTELGVHGYQGEDIYLAVGSWFGQTSADQWIDKLIDLMAAHKPLCFFGESGQIRRSIEPFLRRRMRERRVNCRLEWLTRGRDKPTMARALQGLAAMGHVKLPNNEYGHRLLAQMLAFPAGKYDDAVDMAVLMGMAIDQAHPALVAAEKRPLEPRDYVPVTDDEEIRDWRVA